MNTSRYCRYFRPMKDSQTRPPCPNTLKCLYQDLWIRATTHAMQIQTNSMSCQAVSWQLRIETQGQWPTAAVTPAILTWQLPSATCKGAKLNFPNERSCWAWVRENEDVLFFKIGRGGEGKGREGRWDSPYHSSPFSTLDTLIFHVRTLDHEQFRSTNAFFFVHLSTS